MLEGMRAVLLCLFGVLAAPASASAATLVKSGSTLTYTAAAGRTNQPTFTADPGAIRVTRGSGDDDPITAPTGCTPVSGGYTCAGVSLVVVDAGDRDDIVTATGISAVAQLTGGAGNDQLLGGSGADRLLGGDGDDALAGNAGNDVLDGAAGDDELSGDAGTDQLTGGPGIDHGFYGAQAPTPAPAVTLDDVANDGVPGENDNFATDIEDVSVLGAVTSTLVGSAGPNVLVTGAGNDTVGGGAGNDSIDAGAGDDAIDARDGFADRVDCGPGADTVTADTLDLASASCETVDVVDVGNANEDRPPTIAWLKPASRARLGARTTLSVNVGDDRGVARVRYLVGTRMACEATAAPFACEYRPTGDDVGRDTLTAVAIDGSGQTAAVQRVVTVKRFTAVMSLGARKRGDTYTVGGVLYGPDTVTRKQACSGTVTLRVKSHAKTLMTRKSKLTNRCTYAVRYVRTRGKALRLTATFPGNAYILPRSKTVTKTLR
jgi:hypothetical protein